MPVADEMHPDRLGIALEVVRKRAFAWAVDWPGWCRSGKDPELAIASLLDHAGRYAVVARTANLVFPVIAADHLETIVTAEGGSGTEFGVPSSIIDLDRLALDGPGAARLASLVEAAWIVFDRVAAGAPAELRKGPRGGGRDRDKVIGHVVEADHAYAREIGARLPPPSPADRAAVSAERAAIAAVLREPTDGSPLADRKWTVRYAARRIAWHALDHAWEIEDRTEPL
jgi:hypothetical protein